MKFGFDLDGTLDKPEIAYLANQLLASGHEVHIITSIFPESGEWQNRSAKLDKLNRIGVPVSETLMAGWTARGQCRLHVIEADKSGTIEERLRVIGLMKGDLCGKLGIDVFFDDSSLYCDMIPKMDGHVTVLQVR